MVLEFMDGGIELQVISGIIRGSRQGPAEGPGSWSFYLSFFGYWRAVQFDQQVLVVFMLFEYHTDRFAIRFRRFLGVSYQVPGVQHLVHGC